MSEQREVLDYQGYEEEAKTARILKILAGIVGAATTATGIVYAAHELVTEDIDLGSASTALVLTTTGFTCVVWSFFARIREEEMRDGMQRTQD